MADIDGKAAEKAKKVAAAKKKLAAYRKSKKSKRTDVNPGDGDFSDTASEASYATSSDVASLASVDDRSTPDSEAMADGTLLAEDAAALEKQLSAYSKKLAILEETLDGKDGAIMSLSEENARLAAELDSLKHNGEGVNGSTLTNGEEKDTQQLQATIHELSAHLQQYQAAVLQRDQAIQQLSEQSRQLQEQNRQLQTPSRSASEDGLDYAAQTETLKVQVEMLKEQLEQANASLSRQSAPSPQPIVDAKNEIITLQQNLAAQEQVLQQLKAAVVEKDGEINQLKSESSEKDLSIQALGVKISKKSEALSELSEELDLFKAKDSENLQLINELKAQGRSEATGSDADSIASGGYSEDELEEKQQELRNVLDEQFGQNMMVMKESMSQQYEQSQKSLQKELEDAKQQVARWESWGQNAQAQFQQQLQQQLAALNQQLSEKHRVELQAAQQAGARQALAASSTLSTAVAGEGDITRLKEQHEEEMKVLVDTAEEEANSLKERIAQLELSLKQSATSEPSSEEMMALQERLNEMNAQIESSHSEFEQLKQLYDSSQQQLSGLMDGNQTMEEQLTQFVKKLESVEEEKQALQKQLDEKEQQRKALGDERENLKHRLDQLNAELDQSQGSNSKMSAEVESLQEKCAQLIATNQQLVDQSDGETAAVESNQLLKEENGRLESKLSGLNRSMDELKKGLGEKENKIAELEKMQQQGDETSSQLAAIREELEQKIQAMEQNLADKDEQNTSVLRQLEDKQQELQESLAQTSELNRKLENLSVENRQLQDAQTKLDTGKTEQMEQLQAVQLELDTARKHIENMTCEQQRLQEELSGQQEKLANTKSELSQAKSQESDFGSELAKVEAELGDMARERESMVQEQQQLEESLNREKQERQQLEESLNQEQQQRQQLGESLDQEKQERQQLGESLCQEKQERHQLEERLNREKQERQQLEESLNQEKQERQQLGESLDQEKQERQQLGESLVQEKQERHQLEERLNREQQERQQLGESLDQEKQERQQLEATLLSEKNNLQKQLDSVTECLSDTEKEKAQVQENYTQLSLCKDEEIQQLQGELNDSKAQLESALNEKDELGDVKTQLEETKLLLEKASRENEQLKDAEFKVEELEQQVQKYTADSEKLSEVEAQLETSKEVIEQITAQNQQLQEEKLRHLQEAATSDAVKDELATLMAENQSLTQQLTDHQQLQKEVEQYEGKLLETNEKLRLAAENFETFKDKHSDYDELKLKLGNVSDELAISLTDAAQLKVALETASQSLQTSEHSNQMFKAELEASASALNASNDKLVQLTTDLEKMKHSNQINIDELKLANQSEMDDLRTQLSTLLQERDSLQQSSQEQLLEYQKRIASLEESVEKSQHQASTQANELTHSFEEERLILNFKIKDLEAKLEDSTATSHQNMREEVNMAVAQALREQQVRLDAQHEDDLAKQAKENAQHLETERRQMEMVSEQKFIQQMNETRNELEKQRQKDLKEMQQAFSKDSAKQMQALYDQIQEKEKAIATLNKELSQSQDVISRLSEETMGMEELRSEKESLQAQLDKVSGELEDFDRVASPTVLTDQERLLRENPVLSDQVEDSGKYQSLADENEQLKTLLDQLRESDAGKLKIGFEQLKQENEALREQLQYSMIPERTEAQLTDSSKAEMESLKTNLAEVAHSRQEVVDRYTALHAQYTEMENQYKQALHHAINDKTPNDDLLQQIEDLKGQCQKCESRIGELSDEVTSAQQEKEEALQALKDVEGQLAGTAEAYQKLRSESNVSPSDVQPLQEMQAKLSDLEGLLRSSEEEIIREQHAKSKALSELQAVKENVATSANAADELKRLKQENEALRLELSKARQDVPQVAVHEQIFPMHSTPRGTAPSHDGQEREAQHSDDLSNDVSALRRDMDQLQLRYHKDTSDLRSELDVERKNVEDLRQEMHESFNSSAQSLDSSNLANLTDLVASLQGKNERLHEEKQELNRQLMEQERLSEKLHERLGVAESLSSGVQESHAKQLAAAQRQRDEILQQLEEATRVNDQVSQLVAERNRLQQERVEASAKLQERDELEAELHKMKMQLESLAQSYSKMSETLAEKDEAGLKLGKRNAILEDAVKKMEAKLAASENAYRGERQVVQGCQKDIEEASKEKSELEKKLGEEKSLHRRKLTAELQQAKTASEKSRLLHIRQERLEIERKYKETIEKLRQELAEETKRKQESLRSQREQHEKQLKDMAEVAEQRIQQLVDEMHRQQAAQLATDEQASQQVKELEQLNAQFDKEADKMRVEMDAVHQQQFDEVLRAHQAQLQQERISHQAEMEAQLKELKTSLELAQSHRIQQLADTFNLEKALLVDKRDQERITLQEEYERKLSELEERQAVALADLTREHQVEMAESNEEAVKELISIHDAQLQTLADRHARELSNLRQEMEDKFTEERSTIEEAHLAQLTTTRAQLVINDSLDRDYRELKADLDRLRLERDINRELINQLEQERDALRQQALDSSLNLSRIHNEDITELSRYYEEKMEQAEQEHIEQITSIKEQYELMLDRGGASADYQKPYHTGDSMTESLRAKEKEKTKIYHTMTVLSDLDSSEGSPPRMSADELGDALDKEKNEQISCLEKEVEELTTKLVDAEHQLEQVKAELIRLSREREASEAKLTSQQHKIVALEELNSENEMKYKRDILEVKEQYQQELAAAADINDQALSDSQERHLAEITKCKLAIANLTGQLIETQSGLEKLQASKEEELRESFKTQLSQLQSEHELRLSEELGHLTESLQARHSEAISQLEQRLLEEKQEEIKELKADRDSQVNSLEKKVEELQGDLEGQLEQMENEYKISLDSLQSEKQQVDIELENILNKYEQLEKAVQDGSHPRMLALRQELSDKHEEQKDRLCAEYNEQIRQVTDDYEDKMSVLKTSMETQIKDFRAEHATLLDKALEERQQEVQATIDRYEEVVAQLIAADKCTMEELEAKFAEEMDSVKEASAHRLRDLEGRHKLLLEEKEQLYEQSLALLKEQLLADHKADLDEQAADLKQSHTADLEQLLDTLRQEQADEMMGLQEKHEAELRDANLKADDLDAAHTEELRILADEHDEQLQLLREQLNTQLEKMSAELETLQTNHESELVRQKNDYDRLLEEALVEQHNDHETDIARRIEINDNEREAWEAERAAHDAEVQALQDQLNLERGEYKFKIEESNGRVRELLNQLKEEQTQSKETSSLWSSNMAELRTEQEELKQQQQQALNELEEKYKSQIDKLHTHLQRVVADNKNKDEQIKQLEAETARLQQQITKSTDSNELVSQLQTDLDHLRQARDAIGSTNQRLLELLSGAVESQRALETNILSRIGPGHGLHREDRSTPVSRSSRPTSRAGAGNMSPPRGAAADPATYGAAAASPVLRGARMLSDDEGTITPHEKSFESEMADEGLDLSHFSQTREISMFAGPHLNYSEEETVLETGRHLQEVVDMLLSRIENTNAELAEAKQQQEELMAQLKQKNSMVKELNREATKHGNAQEDLEQHVERLMEENAQLGRLRSDLFEQKELNEELQTAKAGVEGQLETAQENLNTLMKEVNSLKAEREAVHELKDHVETQHQALTDGASDSEKKLLAMNSQLELELRALQSRYDNLLEETNTRMQHLESQLADITREHEKEINSLTEANNELQQQIESLVRNSLHDKQFLEQQTAEREMEREEAAKLAEALSTAQEELKASEAAVADLQAQVNETEKSLENVSAQHEAYSQANRSESELFMADLGEKDQTISKMKEAVDTLEVELQSSLQRERSLQMQLDSFQGSQMDRTQFNELSQPANNHLLEEISQRLEESLKALQVMRGERDALSDEVESLKLTADEYMQEKATLQSTVYEQMSDISSLKSQLEAVRHLGGSKPVEPSRVEQLSEQLHQAKDALERKEQETEGIMEELDMLKTQLTENKQKEEELRSQLTSEQAHYEGLVESERDRMEELKQDNERLLAELGVLQASSNEMSIDDLMKALIQEKDEEIHQLQGKLSQQRSDEVDSSEVLRLQEELSAKTAELDDLSLTMTSKSARVDELERMLAARNDELVSVNEHMKELRGVQANLNADFDNIEALAAERDAQIATITANVESLEQEKISLLDEKEALMQDAISLGKQLRESTNVVNEKEEDLYVVTEKVEDLEREKAELTSLKERLSETNKELAMEVGSLRQLASSKQEEVTEAKTQCDKLKEQLTELQQSLAEMDSYRVQCEQLAQELSTLRMGDEASKSEIDNMISEKISLAIDLDKVRQESSALAAKLASNEEEMAKVRASLDLSENELDTVRGSLLDTQTQLRELKLEHVKVLQARDRSLDAGDSELLKNMELANSEVQGKLKEASEELQLTIADRDALVKEVSSLREQIDGHEQLSHAVRELKEENARLEQRLASSHDASLVDERLMKLQEALESQLKEKDRELQEMSESTQEQIADQKESYEDTINSLNEKIVQMRSEFEQEYQRLKEQVLDEVSSRLQDNMEESFSESLRKDIEGRIAIITNGHMRDSDQDTLADTCSVSSSNLGDEVTVKDRQKHHLDQIEKESNSIYKLSDKASAFGENMLESVLQEKEILNATIQSLKDLLSQIDNARANAQMNDSSPSDWRASLIHGVHQVFQHERDLYLQELRTFVAARGELQPTEIERLESKLRSMMGRQESSMDQLFDADRQSLLDEIAEHRTLANHMKNETVQILGQLERQKAEAAQLAEMNEAKLSQQIALIEDSNKALSSEQKRNASLTQELSSLRDKCFALEGDITSSNAELDHAKQLLTAEHNKLTSLQLDIEEAGTQLSNEMSKGDLLEQQLRQHGEERQRLFEQMQLLEKERLAEREDAQHTAQTLRQEVQLLRDQASELHAKLERETLVHQTTKRQLVDAEHDAANRERTIKGQVAQLELSLDIEKARNIELSQEMSQEKSRIEEMKHQISELQARPTVSEHKQICDERDSEKSRVLDIQSALSREKNRSANMSAALDLARAQALEEVENERRIVGQVRRELKAKQRDLDDVRAQLQSERSTLMSMREELAQLQATLETSNAASFEAQKRLSSEQTARQLAEDAVQDTRTANEELRRLLAEAEVAVAEKERLVEAQHRDLAKMRNQLSRRHDESVNDSTAYPSRNIYKKLRLIALRLKETSENTQNELGDVFTELRALDDVITGSADPATFASPSESARLLEFVERLSYEKEELRQTLSQLEAEIQRYRQREAARCATPTASQGGLTPYWHGVVNDLYARMRHAESRVRCLTHQKKVVLQQLGGYEECEKEVLRRLANMGAVEADATPTRAPPLRKFRAAVRVVIISRRLRWLVSRSRKLVRDGVQNLIKNSTDGTKQGSKSHSRPSSTTVSPLVQGQGQPSRPDSRNSSAKVSRTHRSHNPPSESSQACSTVYTNHRKQEVPANDPWMLREHSGASHSTSSTSRPVSQQSVQSSRPTSRQSHRSLKADGNRKLSSKVSSRDNSQSTSSNGSRSITPLAGFRTGSPGASPRLSSPATIGSTSNHPSRRLTPRSSRGSPVSAEGRTSPSTGSYNPSRHVRCFPQQAYDRPVDNRVSHDDSVAENINRLERLQERLTDMQKPGSSSSSTMV